MADLRPRVFVVACAVLASLAAAPVFAAYDYRDTLDRAVALPDDTGVEQTDFFTPFVGDGISYDGNLYRLRPGFSDVESLPGIDGSARKQDYTNTVSGGLDAQWLIGQRQSFDVDVRADDNRFAHSGDLDYIGTNDRAAWNWGLGSGLSGEVGADYTRFLGGYVNTANYARDVISRSEYFASARYQVGPRWMLFGGLLDSNYSFEHSLTYNNSKSKAVDMGALLLSSSANKLGVDYRYTDSRYPFGVVLGGNAFDPDFREDRARILGTYAPTDKTLLDVNFGYLKRAYANYSIGSFSGDIGRIVFQWQPSLKTQLVATAWRELNADLTAQTDYFVSRGISAGPIWTASEKLTLTLTISRENHDYVGSTPAVSTELGTIAAGAVTVAQGPDRKDSVTAEQVTVVYTPTGALTFNAFAGYERRGSNLPEFQYNDPRGGVGFVFKFWAR